MNNPIQELGGVADGTHIAARVMPGVDARSIRKGVRNIQFGGARIFGRIETLSSIPSFHCIRPCTFATCPNHKGGAMFRRFLSILSPLIFALSALALAPAASAQTPILYGAPINADNARKAAAAALAEAKKNNWTMAVAITDGGGDLVFFEKMDGTQTGSVDVALRKARSAAMFKRPTKVFQDAVAAGGDGLRILGLQGAVPLEGGIPLLMDGKIVGAIGLAGGSAPQDGQAAKAGADVLK